MNKWLRRLMYWSVSRFRLSEADYKIEHIRALRLEIQWAKREIEDMEWAMVSDRLYLEELKQYLMEIEEMFVEAQ